MGRITDNRADVYKKIIDQLIAMIEAGTRPWSKSWNGSTAPNIPLRSTGVPYCGINILTLWVAPLVLESQRTAAEQAADATRWIMGEAERQPTRRQ